MKPQKKEPNYISATFYFALSTLLILVGLWFLPTYEGTFQTRKINIMSDLISDSLLNQIFVSPTSDQNVEQKIDQLPKIKIITPDDVISDYAKSITVNYGTERRAGKNEYVPVCERPSELYPEISAEPITVKHDSIADKQNKIDSLKPILIAPKEAVNNQSVPQIENMNEARFKKFMHKLQSGAKVRIAVAGDSFIEGDIFTQDMRELLQQKYGGAGVGFVPITSQVAGFRQSVEHKFGGWTTKSVVNGRADFHLSGYIFTPTEGAWVQYKGSRYRQHLNEFLNAKLLFVNKFNTEITAIVNDSVKLTFKPQPSEALQSISIDRRIKSIKFIVKNVTGFVAYGAVLDGDGGVSVDNYSVRSYSGAGLANISENMAEQSNQIIPYDLIILQYGLNVANEGNTNYTQYAQKLHDVVTNLKRVMPNSAILVMSVSDRQSRNTGKTMPAIYSLERNQRAVAGDCDVAFWSTLYAMQNAGGIGVFVQKGWAAKDYTHLSARGGKVMANIFVKALNNEN